MGIKLEDLKYIDRFKDLRVLVIGDVMLDQYIIGTATRISPEAPVPVIKLERQCYSVGGAGNVARNVALLGAKTYLFGSVGCDFGASRIRECLHDYDNITYQFTMSNTLQTTIKTRIIADGVQMVRLDREGDSNRNQTAQLQKENLITFIKEEVKEVDAIIISDYNKGILHEHIIPIIKENLDGLVFVDAKPNNLYKFYNVPAIIKPNKKEAFDFCKMNDYDPANVVEAGKFIQNFLKAHSVLITEGKDGMTLIDFLGHVTKIPSIHTLPIGNAIGAGDVSLAVFALAVVSDMEMDKAAILANIAGALSLWGEGTGAVTAKELKDTAREWI